MQPKTRFEHLYANTGRMELVTVGILGTAVSLASEDPLLQVLRTGLLIADPVISI